MKKLFSIILSVTLIVSTAFALPILEAPAQTKQEQRQELQEKLDLANKKLKEIGEEKKDTQEYLDALDERLSVLKKEYSITKQEVSEATEQVDKLEQQISDNESTLVIIDSTINKYNDEIVALNDEFSQTAEEYYARMRAIYISGEAESTLAFLLKSDGIENLLTRLEMINSISRRDSALMRTVKTQTEKIVSLQADLKDKQIQLEQAQAKLGKDKKSLKAQRSALIDKEAQMAEKSIVIEKQQSQANDLLKELNDKSKEYGEFRDITQEELDAIDDAIAEADKKYAQVTTTTTTTKKPTTTTTTTQPSEEEKPTTASTTSTTTKPTTTTTTRPATTTSKAFRLTYPCPSYPKITCGFGDYSGHTGCDFSTNGKENQRIVAAESGTVILSTDITCNRSTCKKKNHGGGYCSYGRYIVIRHDKTTASGKVVYTLYAHNNTRVATEGSHVEKGETIAYSGSTGNSTGPHLHFEVRVGGSSQSYAQDPEIYLP